jgi:hypothetical protein
MLIAQAFHPFDIQKDKTIVLNPDTNDSYILSYYVTGRYRIEIGYTAYFKKLNELSKYGIFNGETAIKHYVDSVKSNKKIVPLYNQHAIYFKDTTGGDFELNSYTDQIVADLFYEGNIKVYDFRKKRYLDKITISGKEANQRQFNDYIDSNTGKIFFTYTISFPVY